MRSAVNHVDSGTERITLTAKAIAFGSEQIDFGVKAMYEEVRSNTFAAKHTVSIEKAIAFRTEHLAFPFRAIIFIAKHIHRIVKARAPARKQGDTETEAVIAGPKRISRKRRESRAYGTGISAGTRR